MEIWKRRQISLARQWYVDNFDNVEPDRPQFYGEQAEKDTLRGRVLVYYSSWKRFLKYTCSFSVLLMMVSGISKKFIFENKTSLFFIFSIYVVKCMRNLSEISLDKFICKYLFNIIKQILIISKFEINIKI